MSYKAKPYSPPKRLASQYEIRPDEDNPDVVWVAQESDDWEFGTAEPYNIVQFGLWRWKSFAICFLIPNMAAGGIGSDHWEEVSDRFPTREEARLAARAGQFTMI